VFRRIFGLFTQYLTFNGCILPPLQLPMLCHNRREKKEQKFRSRSDHDQTVVNPTDRGMVVTVASSFFIGCVAEINQSFL